jgi:hypothetical protein
MSENHSEAFKELEFDICDLARAADLASLMAFDEDSELTFFAVRQLQSMATSLKEKYYQLWGSRAAA